MWYKLVNKEVVKCADGEIPDFDIKNRRVADDTINGVRVSTVFLALDHGYDGCPPIVFETMVFGGGLDGEMKRYATWQEAEKGHAEMIKKVKGE